MGDGVLVYFGYPRAHEDDAERAVRAGLALIDAVGRLEPIAPSSQVRVGIATGLVVVGDLIGEGAARSKRSSARRRTSRPGCRPGRAEHAGHRRQHAPAGRRAVRSRGPRAASDSTASPSRSAPGGSLGESGVVSRFEALRSRADAAGRARRGNRAAAAPLAAGQERRRTGGADFRRAGHRQVAADRGALRAHRSEPHTRLRYFCSPHHQDSALYPFIASSNAPPASPATTRPKRKLDKLRALLAPGSRDDDDIALLSELLSLPSSAADLNLSPQRKREKLFEALLGQLEAESRQPAGADGVRGRALDRSDLARAAGSDGRPGAAPAGAAGDHLSPRIPAALGRSPHVTSLALNRLGERDGAALVQELAGNAALPADVVAEIVERTDGVPLFVEELTKAVLESAAQDDRVAAVLATTSLAALSVPPTLHASLMARLDRLGAAKEIAQIGAVLGREFGYELIEPVAQRPDEELQAALDQLSDAGLLFCRGIAPHASYLFKHALVQDAAYGTLLRGRGRNCTRASRRCWKQQFADLVERQPELLAHHLTGAGDTERAVDQWLKAGQHAAARSAHVEAIAPFRARPRDCGVIARRPGSRRTGDRAAIGARSVAVHSRRLSLGRGGQAYRPRSRARRAAGRSAPAVHGVYGLWQSANGTGMILECRDYPTGSCN